MKQQRLFKNDKMEFGGELLTNKRKSLRPLSPKSPVHLVLKADIEKSGSLLKHRTKINDEINRWSEKFSIQVISHALCSNHIHIAALATDKESYNRFIRTITGRLAQSLKIKWLKRPYTKPVNWGRPLENLISYIRQNHEEAIGLRPYTPR